MKIAVDRVRYEDIEALRDLYRAEARCQIIRDAIIRRNRAEAYLITVDGRVGGYGGVRTDTPGRLMEFFTLPAAREFVSDLFLELLKASKATHVEAQTNMPQMLGMLYDTCTNITEHNILFEDHRTTHLTCEHGIFRRTTTEDSSTVFAHYSEPPGDWLIESNGSIVATDGAFYHYNPPYGDIYMEVEESARKHGFGSYLVQEVKRICYESGKIPVARCNIKNIASRKTLQKAGFLPCARLLVGEVHASLCKF